MWLRQIFARMMGSYIYTDSVGLHVKSGTKKFINWLSLTQKKFINHSEGNSCPA